MHRSTQQGLSVTDNVVPVMMELVRAAVLNMEPDISGYDVIDWDKLMDESSEQGVLAWVWDGICKLPQEQKPPRVQYINFGMSAQEIWERYERQQQLLKRLIDVCNCHNMRLLLLKGIELSKLYPKPKSRPCGDLDVYLFDDFDKFNNILNENYKSIDGHHAILSFDGIMVENHLDFLNPEIRNCTIVSDYIKSTLSDVRYTNLGYYILSPMANLVFLTMHSMKHIYADLFISIRSVLDFSMFLKSNRQELSPNDCFNQLGRLQLEKGFEVLLYMSEYFSGFNFEEYHQNVIPPKYVLFLHQWMETDFRKPNMAKVEELGIMAYYSQLKHNRMVRRYMMKFERRIGYKIIGNVINFTRALFHVPHEKSLKEYVRRKV